MTRTRQSLLIAGPCQLDTHAGQEDLLGGAGIYAAIAAAPCCHTQLWSRSGADFPSRLRELLEQRRIDISGMIDEGPSRRNATAEDSVLPSVKPTDPQGLGGTLITGIGDAELEDAITCLAALRGIGLHAVHLDASHCHRANIERAASHAQLLIVDGEQACRSLGLDNPLQVAAQLFNDSLRCLVCTHGMWGGLLVYKGKATTYASLPHLPKDSTGVSATFAGAMMGLLVEYGKIDYRGLKRHLATASAVAGLSTQGIGPKRLFALDRNAYTDAFNRLRRNHKF